MGKRGRITGYRPREGVLESLGVSEDELRDAVFDSFANSRLECHASIGDLPVVLKGRTYRLEEVAYVKTAYGKTREDGCEVP
jgi:hypothetical protein